MQLKIQRSQRMGGLMGNTVLFCLDVRADYAPQEAANIAKYKLGKEVIYNSRAAKRHMESASGQLDRTQAGGVGERAAGLVRGAASLALAAMNLNISIASLGSGHHIECKDLSELTEAEEAVMEACRNVRDFLKLAATFNGSTILVDFSQTDEQVHTAMGSEVYAPVPQIAAARAPVAVMASPSAPAAAIAPVRQVTATDAVFEEMPAPPMAGTATASPDFPQLKFADIEKAILSLATKLQDQYSARPAIVVGSALAAALALILILGFQTFLILLAALGAAGLIFLFVRQS